MMRLAITSTDMELSRQAPVVFRGPNAQCMRQIHEIGYDGVELHIHDSAVIDRSLLKEQLQKSGLQLTSIGTGTAYGRDHIFLASGDAAVRAAAVDRLKEHIITAKDYPHAVVIIGLIKGKVSDCSDEAEYHANLVASLKECGRIAEEHRVYLGAEVINRYESDFMNTIDDGLKLLDEVGCPFIQLHLDTYHMNMEEADIPAAIKRAKGRICHVHMADNDRWYVGHGHYNFEETIGALKEIGYEHALSVESLGYPDMVTSGRKSFEEMSRILKKIY